MAVQNREIQDQAAPRGPFCPGLHGLQFHLHHLNAFGDVKTPTNMFTTF